MTRYIDVDAIVEEMDRYLEQCTKVGIVVDGETCFYKVNELLAYAPTADVVEVVRCKDCCHIFDGDCPITWEKTDDDFCSYGERRE